MNFTVRQGLVILGAVVAAMIQLSLVSSGPLRSFVDLVGLLVVWWLIRRDMLAAVLTAIVGGGFLDYFLGWRLPAHAVLGLVAVGLYYLLSHRWLSAQTATAVWLNVAIVFFVTGALRWMLSGWSFVSYPDQRLVLSDAFVWIFGRTFVSSLVAAVWQRIQRRSFTRLAANR